jgi:L-serine dehydratase
VIQTSIFELFKIGPGPSSSHTVGPIFIANDFRERISEFLKTNRVNSHHKFRLSCELFGSLADTGIGHGTHRAILAGLFGYTPIDVDVEKLNSFFSSESVIYEIPMSEMIIPFEFQNIQFNHGENPHRHPNTMRFTFYKDDHLVLDELYYSIGGGFFERESEDVEVPLLERESSEVEFRYSSMDEFLSLIEKYQLDYIELLIRNEMSLTKKSKEDIYKGLDQILKIMSDCVERGLSSEGTLPGGLNISRRAKYMYEQTLEMERTEQKHNIQFTKMNAYALAVSEENAAGNIVVTAPTNGAAGIIPATLAYLKRDENIDVQRLREGLIISALIGFIVKENASISGAELGCMAEVGTATAMAAAIFSHVYSKNIYTISVAAEIALEHSLGMTCDPINGLVQVPCIERNATGVIKAYNAFLLANGRVTKPLISLDQVIKVMRETGLDLSEKYRETSTGGLAVHGWDNMPGS